MGNYPNDLGTCREHPFRASPSRGWSKSCGRKARFAPVVALLTGLLPSKAVAPGCAVAAPASANSRSRSAPCSSAATFPSINGSRPPRGREPHREGIRSPRFLLAHWQLQTLKITTNTVECYFSIFKRGMKGVYQHCSEKHLHRYLAEFDFRYNNRAALGVNDEARADRLIGGIVGKRLTYRDSSVGFA
jgi:hypothetical protein